MQPILFDAAGHRRSRVTMPGFHEGVLRGTRAGAYPADPPTVEEIIAVMRAAGDGPDGARLRVLIVVLWRAGLRIGEALDLAETDLDATWTPPAEPFSCVAARVAVVGRWGWIVGPGLSCSRGWTSGAGYRSERCCA